MSIAQKCKIDKCQGVGFTKKSGTVVYPLGYCGRHYQQYRKHGCIVDTGFDPRPAIIEGDIAKIPLGINARQGYAIVDADMAYLADKYKWFTSVYGYAHANTTYDGKKRVAGMHQIIMNSFNANGLEVDHINRNRLDNRRKNLRLVTRSQNNMNKGIQSNNSNRYKGITKRGNKWAASIRLEGVTEQLGAFYSEEEAALAYNKRALELFGEYANLNKICWK